MFSKIFVMKRFVVCLLALVFIVSCSSNVFRGEEQIGDDYISLSSKGFDGEKSYKIKVVSDTSALMELCVEEGVLYIVVEGEEYRPLEGNYSIDWNQYKETTFHIKRGEYSVTLKGKDFVGDCKISWN